MKYVNRLTPVTLIGKATEKGLEEVAKAVLGRHFNLREDQEQSVGDEGNGEKGISKDIANDSVSSGFFWSHCFPPT
jgi:tRNA acetyltransferase TAN1